MDSATFHELGIALKKKLTNFYNVTIGIDNSGKTTLTHRLKYNTNHVFLPTKHSKTTELQIGNLKALVIDMGGHRAVRIAWDKCLCNVDGIVFIVDVSDTDRFDEVRESWTSVIEKEREAPILVLMNKVDLAQHTAESAEMDTSFKQYIQEHTGISISSVNPGQHVRLVYLSIVNEDINKDNTPLRNGFAWLSQMIDLREKSKS